MWHHIAKREAHIYQVSELGVKNARFRSQYQEPFAPSGQCFQHEFNTRIVEVSRARGGTAFLPQNSIKMLILALRHCPDAAF